MSTIALTGSSGGVGRVLTERLEGAGHRVIGIDVCDSEVLVDLSTSGGRRAMVRDVDELCDGALDGLVVASGTPTDDAATSVSVNYFGALAVLDGLLPLLERGSSPAAVAIGGVAATTLPKYSLDIAEWCLSGDETRARLEAARHDHGGYAASALALTLWARRRSATWRRHGVRLNVVAPGFVDGPNGAAWATVHDTESMPLPSGRLATAEDVVGVIEFLLSDAASYINGIVLPIDGGSEAEMRSDDWPRPIGY